MKKTTLKRDRFKKNKKTKTFDCLTQSINKKKEKRSCSHNVNSTVFVVPD